MNRGNSIARFWLPTLLPVPVVRGITNWLGWMGLCIALPLAVCLSYGWIGLLIHWQILCRTTAIAGNASMNPAPACKTTAPEQNA
jgi:hypothetical protein